MWRLFPPVFIGTLREHYLLLFGCAAALAVIVGGLGAWLGAHFGARSALRRAEREREARTLADTRLEQLTRSVDAIALEVERISESQRFAARILAERPPLAPPRREPREPGVVTPH